MSLPIVVVEEEVEGLGTLLKYTTVLLLLVRRSDVLRKRTLVLAPTRQHDNSSLL